MSVVEERVPTSSAPTEARPEAGQVAVFDVSLLEGVRWVDEGTHIIVSTECAVRGEGDDLQGAVEDFVDAAIELHSHLTNVLRAGDDTKRERDEHVLLSERFGAIFVALDKVLDQDQTKPRWFRRQPRLRRRHDWQPIHRSRSGGLLPA